MKVRYTLTALAEIDEIISYIAHDNPKAAADVAAAIEKQLRALPGVPHPRPSSMQGKCVRNWSDAISIAYSTSSARMS